jgi:hypothetical protein
MSSIRCWVVLTLVSGAAALLAMAQPQEPPPPPPPPRVVTVEVTVEAPAGTPVVGIPVELYMSNPFAAAVTDATGKATITGTFPAGTTKIHAGIVMQSTELVRVGSSAEWRVAEATNKAFHFDRFYPIPLTTETAYTLQIVGTPAVTLTGKVDWAYPIKPQGSVVWSNFPESAMTHILANGEFEIGGIPTGEPIDLFVVWRDFQVLQTVHVTASQTQASGSVGVIPGPSVTAGRRVSVSMTNTAPLAPSPERPFVHGKAALVFKSDGAMIFVGVVRPNGVLRVSEHADELLRLPPGTYFFSPGGPDGYSQSIRLYELLKGGQLAAVEAAGVPKLVVPDDGATEILTFSFDAVQAENAIRSIP